MLRSVCTLAMGQTGKSKHGDVIPTHLFHCGRVLRLESGSILILILAVVTGSFLSLGAGTPDTDPTASPRRPGSGPSTGHPT